MNGQAAGDPPEIVDPLGWHPFQFFDYLTVGGPLVMAGFALVCVSCGAFLYLALRRPQIGNLFSLPLFLALVPFGICALISFLTLYGVLRKISIADIIDWGVRGMGEDLREAGYVFQFGILLSGVLVVTHAYLHFRSRMQQGA